MLCPARRCHTVTQDTPARRGRARSPSNAVVVPRPQVAVAEVRKQQARERHEERQPRDEREDVPVAAGVDVAPPVVA
jgi:hypothetical protein